MAEFTPLLIAFLNPLENNFRPIATLACLKLVERIDVHAPMTLARISTNAHIHVYLLALVNVLPRVKSPFRFQIFLNFHWGDLSERLDPTIWMFMVDPIEKYQKM